MRASERILRRWNDGRKARPPCSCFRRGRVLLAFTAALLVCIRLATFRRQFEPVYGGEAASTKGAQPSRAAVHRLVAVLDGAELLPGTYTASLWSRLQREPLAERLRRAFPRSAAERRFLRKTQLAQRGHALVMNAGLIAESDGAAESAVDTLESPSARLLLAFRASITEQGPSDLYLQYLDATTLAPTGAPVALSRARSLGGAWYGPPWREDPRLFALGGALGVAYTVTSAYERDAHAYQVWQRQAFALLDGTLNRTVSDVFLHYGNNHEFVDTVYPRFEKNWLFFQLENTLHVIYSIQPYTLLVISDLLRPQLVARVDWRHGGASALRGSAPPVLVGDAWYLWVHTPAYAVHVLKLTANAQKPLAISAPVIDAAEGVFLCGAIFIRDTQSWLLSGGRHDREIVLLSVHMSAIEWEEVRVRL